MDYWPMASNLTATRGQAAPSNRCIYTAWLGVRTLLFSALCRGPGFEVTSFGLRARADVRWRKSVGAIG